ncbi:DUF302 domain-containing protein [Flavicella marina]|uniref:DUF302 domain-containing protein n=1 Tax=Flavicella marina TaxID=1475951 RepID=UPI001265A3BA|nr:DUF302 domain-containing protein [Flavicella marina]
MKNIQVSMIIVLAVIISACGNKTKKKNVTEKSVTITQKVDNAVMNLQKSISAYKLVATLDHHRMAAAAGVYTPPAIATIFSDPKIEIPLVQQKQLVGLDLPFKILCYTEKDTANVSIAFTSVEFIQRRHNLEPSLFKDYNNKIELVLNTYPEKLISTTDVSQVNEGFGIVSIKSDFDFPTTINKLKETVMSQVDTKWFSEIDYKKEASDLGVNIRSNTLLLFGGPAPGGKAMMTSPKIGLDAFCQKLLVYEKENGDVWIAYNDIVAFAELYYQNSTKPQQMINQRLLTTFSKAVTQEK